MQKKLDWLQALRGIAALLVVLTHARYYLLETPLHSVAEAMFRPGALGVDLFFIISGFIMVYTTTDSDGSVGYTVRFLIKRMARIWPVYVVLAIIGVQANHSITYYLDAGALINMLKSFLFLPVDSNIPLYYGLPYGIGWTLNFEVYFYLVFAASMVAGRFRWVVFFGWLLLTLVAFPAATRGVVALDVQHNYQFSIDYLNQMTNPIIWTFAAGVVSGLVYKTRFQAPDSLALRCSAVCAVTAAIWWAYSGMATFHGIAQWGGPLAVAFVVVAVTSKTISIPVPQPLLWLGKISFSLYLVHPIAQALLTKTLNSMGRNDLTHTWTHIFATTILSLVFASISYVLLEQKMSEEIKTKMLGFIGKFNFLNLKEPQRKIML